MLFGSCACGQVTYTLKGELIGEISYCHCWKCRKTSGSSFSTAASMRAEDFEVTSGSEQLAFWASAPGYKRYFTRCCGASLYKSSDAEPQELRLRLGTLDSDPGSKSTLHCAAGSKAPWVEIKDDLAIDPSGPPFGTRGH